MRRLVLLGGLVLALSAAIGDASGSCPGWLTYKPAWEAMNAGQLLDSIIARADAKLADPACDPVCRMNWMAAREVAEWSKTHGQTCHTNPLYNTCADYYYHAKFAQRHAVFNNDPIACFNELDHVD